MGTKIQVFNSPAFGQVRTAGTPEQPLFCASDVAKALGYTNPQKAIRDHCKGVNVLDTPTENQHGAIVIQKVNYIAESDVFRLIMKSKAPNAEAFQDWVCGEVLPSIRKTGGYIATQEGDTDAEIMAKALLVAQKTIEERGKRISALQAENEKMLPKARVYDQIIVTPTNNGLKTTTEVANELGMSGQALNKMLIACGIIYKSPSGMYLFTSNYISWQLGKIVSTLIDESKGITRQYIKWNDRGRAYIRALYDCAWDKRRAWHLMKNGNNNTTNN